MGEYNKVLQSPAAQFRESTKAGIVKSCKVLRQVAESLRSRAIVASLCWRRLTTMGERGHCVRQMFDEQKAEQITERIGQGIPVSQVARELQIGRRTIHDWREANPTFAAQFARAKLDGFDAIADEIIPIADDADPKAVDHARLRVDARLKL